MRCKIKGHLKQKQFFENAIKNNRLSHSYIFSGISGIGKRLFAINLARSLFCMQGSFFSDCSCPACTQVENGVYPDLHIYSGSELKVENIRAVSELAGMTALSGRYKVFIFDEAEKLSNSNQVVAGNAFLKTLEEPSADSLFILITSKYDLILPTIRSRCSLVNFSPLSEKDMAEILTDIKPEIKNHKYISDISGGSVEKAVLFYDLEIDNVISTVVSGDIKSFAEYVINISDAKVLKTLMEGFYPVSLKRYKETGNILYSLYGDYLLEYIKRLNYNINIELAKNDFVSKTIEVFGERI